MSLRPTFATLYGFDIQHQIPALLELGNLLHEHPPDDIDLETVAGNMKPRRGILGTTWLKHPMTSDHYRWFGALEGTTGSGKIALLIPYCSDRACDDDVVLDRRPALYATGDVPARTANAFVRQVFMHYQGVMAQKEVESAAIRMGRFRF